MSPRERYLPVEVDFSSAKARFRIKVRENETAEDMAKRIKGIEVEETRMGAYIRRINLYDMLFKNEDIIVDYLDGDIRSVSGKDEQWIQVYVDHGLPVIIVNGEPIGLGISNFYVRNVNILTIKDEEKTEKYMRDFSSSDTKAIMNAAISNRVVVSCPGETTSAEISRKVFDVFLLLGPNGVVSFYDGSPETKPLGWREWVFPEKEVNKKFLDRMLNINVEYLVGAPMLKNKKMDGFEVDRTKDYGYNHHKNSDKPENAQEQKIEIQKIENFDAVDVFDAQLKPAIRTEHPVFTQEKNSVSKPKILTWVYTPGVRKYVLFDEEEKLERMKRINRKRTGCTTLTVGEQQKQNILEMPSKEKMKVLEEFFVKKMKISLQLVARIENMKNKLESKITILKEKIQKIKINGLIASVFNEINIAKHGIKKTKIYFRIAKLADAIKERVEKLKFELKTLNNNKNKKSDSKNKRVIIFLLLERWFPKIKRVVKCSL
ncbi:MAG: hypothetical protein ACPL06_00545 [Candidatus Anstonellales archaeon]